MTKVYTLIITSEADHESIIKDMIVAATFGRGTAVKVEIGPKEGVRHTESRSLLKITQKISTPRKIIS